MMTTEAGSRSAASDERSVIAHDRAIYTMFGVPIDALTMSDAVALADKTISERARLLVGVVNSAKLVNMRRNAELRDSVLTCDIVLADGMPIVWVSRLLRKPLPERVAGIDFMIELLRQADDRHHRVYFLGAKQDVVDDVVEHVRREYPGVVIAGSHDGYFDESQQPQIAEDIRASRPDILFVAITPPKKERFLARWSQHMQVPVCHGVGGAFDVVAGRTKRAPVAWQRLGLEWFYRFMQEPRRMWRRYLVTNTLFLGMVIREIFRPARYNGS